MNILPPEELNPVSDKRRNFVRWLKDTWPGRALAATVVAAVSAAAIVFHSDQQQSDQQQCIPGPQSDGDVIMTKSELNIIPGYEETTAGFFNGAVSWDVANSSTDQLWPGNLVTSAVAVIDLRGGNTFQGRAILILPKGATPQSSLGQSGLGSAQVPYKTEVELVDYQSSPPPDQSTAVGVNQVVSRSPLQGKKMDFMHGGQTYTAYFYVTPAIPVPDGDEVTADLARQYLVTTGTRDTDMVTDQSVRSNGPGQPPTIVGCASLDR